MASATSPDALTPAQAASAVAGLRDLEGFEDGLTARVGALTLLLWAIVSAAIFVTYGLALVAGHGGWWLAFLWAPWVALGAVASSFLWRLHAISLRRDTGATQRSGAWFGLAIMGFFVAAALLLHLLAAPFHGLSHTTGMFHYMLGVNGLGCFLLVLLASRRVGRLTAAPLLASGALMLVASFALVHVGGGDAGAAAFSAAVVAVGYGGAGIASFVRG